MMDGEERFTIAVLVTDDDPECSDVTEEDGNSRLSGGEG